MLMRKSGSVRRSGLLLVALVLLATVIRGPSIYFCPSMGALPKPCCESEGPDRVTGACCSLISVEESRFQAHSMTVPPPDLSSDPLPVSAAEPLTACPDAGLSILDESVFARSSPPDIYLVIQSFLI
jgi:hypothetical protein